MRQPETLKLIYKKLLPKYDMLTKTVVITPCNGCNCVSVHTSMCNMIDEIQRNINKYAI